MTQSANNQKTREGCGCFWGLCRSSAGKFRENSRKIAGKCFPNREMLQILGFRAPGKANLPGTLGPHCLDLVPTFRAGCFLKSTVPAFSSFSETRVYPYPLGAGSARPNPKMGAPDPEKPLFLGFSVLRGGLRPWSQTMVSEGARPWGRGRSGDCDSKVTQIDSRLGPWVNFESIFGHFGVGLPESLLLLPVAKQRTLSHPPSPGTIPDFVYVYAFLLSLVHQLHHNY